MIESRSEAVVWVAAALMAVMVMCFAMAVAQAQNYPLPKPKPQTKLKAQVLYPLPKPNPRRRPQAERKTTRNTTTPVTRAKRPVGTRAAEADDTDGPGGSPKGWSKAEIAAARKACTALLKDVKLTYTEADPIGGPGDCGIAAPIKVTAIGARKSVKVEPAALINCAVAAAAVRWIDTKVQVPALAELGETVVKIRNAASYACRRRNNQKTGKLSEHALGNALDVSSFELSSGKVVTVLKGWRGQKNDTLVEEVVAKVIKRQTPESRFLRQVHAGACEVFSTILGPEADKYHVDHFHLDLGRGGRYLVCR